MHESGEEESDLATQFQHIFHNITNNLDVFNKEIKRKESEISIKDQEIIEQTLEEFTENLDKSEGAMYNEYKGCEDIANWFSAVRNLQDTTFQPIEDQSNLSKANFILQFSTNTSKLKELREDLINKLRNSILERETPETNRLMMLLKDHKSNFEIRKNVLNQMEVECLEAEDKLEKSLKLHKEYKKEMKHAEDQLKIFNGKDSFQVVQNARKSRIIERDWIERINKIKDQIKEVQEELVNFQNPEKYNVELKRQVMSIESEDYRIKSQYQEEIDDIQRELNLEGRTNKSTVDVMMKELQQKRNSLLKEEKRATNTILKKEEISGNRFVNNYKKEKNAQQRSLEKTLKKKEIDLPHIIEAITEDHNKDVNNMKQIIEKMTNDLKEIIHRQSEHFADSFAYRINSVKSMNAKKKAALAANKDRIQQRSLEKAIEMDAVDNELHPLESLYQDVYNDYINLMNANKTKETEILAKQEEIKSFKAKYEIKIKEYSNFIERAKYITEYLRKMIKGRMKEELRYMVRTTSKDDFDLPFEKTSSIHLFQPISNKERTINNQEKPKQQINDNLINKEKKEKTVSNDDLTDKKDLNQEILQIPQNENRKENSDLDVLDINKSDNKKNKQKVYSYPRKTASQSSEPPEKKSKQKDNETKEVKNRAFNAELDLNANKQKKGMKGSKRSLKRNYNANKNSIKTDDDELDSRRKKKSRQSSSEEDSFKVMSSRKSFNSIKSDISLDDYLNNENSDTNKVPHMPDEDNSEGNKSGNGSSIRRSLRRKSSQSQSGKISRKLEKKINSTVETTLRRLGQPSYGVESMYYNQQNAIPYTAPKKREIVVPETSKERDSIFLVVQPLLSSASRPEAYDLGMFGADAKLRKSVSDTLINNFQYRFVLKSSHFGQTFQKKIKPTKASIKIDKILPK